MPLPEHIGRIRINESEAQVLIDILAATRRTYLRLRHEAKLRQEDTSAYQRYLGHVQAIRTEVLTLVAQKGWNIYDEFERPVSQTADPGVPQRPQRRVGERY